MALTPTQEALVDLLNRGKPEQVATFLDDPKNRKTMGRFFGLYDAHLKENERLDYDALVRVLREGPRRHVEDARDYIGLCIDCNLERVPQSRVRLPAALKRKVARREGKAELALFASTIGNTLQDIASLHPLRIARAALVNPIKATAELSAGVLGALGLPKIERQLVTAGAIVPVVAAQAFNMLVVTTDAEAAINPDDIQQQPPITRTERLDFHTNGSFTAYNGERSITDLINGAVQDALSLPKPVARPHDEFAAYRPLMNLIATHEASVGNYNAVYLPYFRDHRSENFDLTRMTINEVRELQQKMVDDGYDSTALGRYQIIDDTMAYLVKRLNLTGNELYDEKLQDEMAVTLLRRRGVDAYLAGNMKETRFITALAKEWASFPKDETGLSYYENVGNNTALLSYDKVLRAVQDTSRLRVSLNGPKQAKPALNYNG
jgi:hypothetical protein